MIGDKKVVEILVRSSQPIRAFTFGFEWYFKTTLEV